MRHHISFIFYSLFYKHMYFDLINNFNQYCTITKSSYNSVVFVFDVCCGELVL